MAHDKLERELQVLNRGRKAEYVAYEAYGSTPNEGFVVSKSHSSKLHSTAPVRSWINIFQVLRVNREKSIYCKKINVWKISKLTLILERILTPWLP